MSKSNISFRIQRMILDGLIVRHKVKNDRSYYRLAVIPCPNCKNIYDLLGGFDITMTMTRADINAIHLHASRRGDF